MASNDVIGNIQYSKANKISVLMQRIEIEAPCACVVFLDKIVPMCGTTHVTGKRFPNLTLRL
jgi:hypothetical protein